MSEEEYKIEFENGMHQTEYNACRFSDDKIQFCKDWILKNHNYDLQAPSNIKEHILNHKVKIAENNEYKELCCAWADKCKVYDKITALGMDNILIPSIAMLNDIPPYEYLKTLGNDIIVKCNHASGWNFKFKLIGDSSINKCITKLTEWNSLNYAYIAGYEAQYENIDRKFLIQKTLLGRDVPCDYGFWYIKGDLQAISITKKLGKNLEEYIGFAGPNGEKLDYCIGMIPQMKFYNSLLMNKINQMKQYTDIIAKPFNMVRVDMYFVNNQVFFGETTFTPSGGNIYINTMR